MRSRTTAEAPMTPIALAATPTLATLSDLDRAVFALCDGARTVPEIATLAARTVGRPVAPWQVFQSLEALQGAALVVSDAASPTPSATARTLRALGAAAALLALGVVPAHAGDDDATEEASDDDDDGDDEDGDDEDGEKDGAKDDAKGKDKAKDDAKAKGDAKAEDKADKEKLTPAEIAQKSREEAAQKRATKRKLDPKRQEERARKRLGPLR